MTAGIAVRVTAKSYPGQYPDAAISKARSTVWTLRANAQVMLNPFEQERIS